MDYQYKPRRALSDNSVNDCDSVMYDVDINLFRHQLVNRFYYDVITYQISVIHSH